MIDVRRSMMAAINPNSLFLVIMPTEKCNFRCRYCYEDFALGRMPPKVVSSIKKYISLRVGGGLKKLQVNWFGGEPLLARNIVEDISRHITATVGGTGCRYTGAMTTNGYLLTNEQAQRNYDLGIQSYQITLDGPQDIHDQTRVRKNGSGSFQQIWNNLIAARNSSLPARYLIRLHVTARNMDSISEFAHLLRHTFGDDDRFSFFPKIVNAYGGEFFDPSSVPPRTDANAVLSEVQALLQKSKENNSEQPSACRSCYASQPTSLVIRSDGRLNKCTVTLNDPRNDVGRLLDDGTLSVEDSKMSYWLRGLASGRADQLTCPAYSK